jgi:hypothetical protein
MTRITVYDPPMCCKSGVCGPEVDPKLAQFSGDLDWLKTQGIEVRRFNLAQEPASFVENTSVKAILDRSGSDELPVILVDDQVKAHARYPSRAELAAMVGLDPASLAVTSSERGTNRCC